MSEKKIGSKIKQKQFLSQAFGVVVKKHSTHTTGWHARQIDSTRGSAAYLVAKKKK